MRVNYVKAIVDAACRAESDPDLAARLDEFSDHNPEYRFPNSGSSPSSSSPGPGCTDVGKARASLPVARYVPSALPRGPSTGSLASFRTRRDGSARRIRQRRQVVPSPRSRYRCQHAGHHPRVEPEMVGAGVPHVASCVRDRPDAARGSAGRAPPAALAVSTRGLVSAHSTSRMMSRRWSPPGRGAR